MKTFFHFLNKHYFFIIKKNLMKKQKKVSQFHFDINILNIGN